MEKVKYKVVIPDEGKKEFYPNIKISEKDLRQCFDFAYEMAFGEGEHKRESFGNEGKKRNAKEIYRDALQGKIAELGFYNYSIKVNEDLEKKLKEEPNFKIGPKGFWEDCDFEQENGNKISVKSTKSYGNLLLLEKDKYNDQGYYLEPYEDNELIKYDYFVLCRVSNVIDFKSIEKEFFVDRNYQEYKNLSKIECEVTGFISLETFQEVISNEQFIQKGILISKNNPMQVDNYYVCAADLSMKGANND